MTHKPPISYLLTGCLPSSHFPLFLLLIITLLSPILLSAEVNAYVVNSGSRTLSKVNLETGQVTTPFATLGQVPNKVWIDSDYLWVVCSSDNAVQKINRQTGATVQMINVASSSNPWDMCADDSYLYVTGLFTNRVYRISKATGSAAGYLNVGTAPEALCVYNGKLYVTNTGGYESNYANSSVSVIDLTSWTVEATIPVTANPQYIIEHAGLLYVSCTGNWTTVQGRIDIINPADNSVSSNIPLNAACGGIWIDAQQHGWVADGSGVNLYEFDANTGNVIHGTTNPLSSGGSVVFGSGNLLAVLYPNWGGNGHLRKLDNTGNLITEYEVGMAPTDFRLWDTTAIDEDNHSPLAQVSIYPNPVPADKGFSLTGAEEHASLTLFNLKGEQVSRYMVSPDKRSYEVRNLPSGIYMYRYVSGITAKCGKISILR